MPLRSAPSSRWTFNDATLHREVKSHQCGWNRASVLLFLHFTFLYRDARNSGHVYVFGGEAVSVIPGTGFIPNSLNTIDGMLRATRMISDCLAACRVSCSLRDVDVKRMHRTWPL